MKTILYALLAVAASVFIAWLNKGTQMEGALMALVFIVLFNVQEINSKTK